jgi:hypothetical protein
MTMKREKTECIPARYSKGKMKDQIVASRVHGARIARDELIKRDRLRFPVLYADTRVENDSTSPNGFKKCNFGVIYISSGDSGGREEIDVIHYRLNKERDVLKSAILV